MRPGRARHIRHNLLTNPDFLDGWDTIGGVSLEPSTAEGIRGAGELAVSSQLSTEEVVNDFEAFLAERPIRHSGEIGRSINL